MDKMDQDKSNTTSVQTGKDCARKKTAWSFRLKKISSMVKNLCEVRTVYLNTATKKSLFH